MKLFSPGEPPEKGEKGSGCQNIFLGNKIPFLLWQKKLILHCRPLFTPLYVWALLFFEGTIAHTRKGTLQTSILQFFFVCGNILKIYSIGSFPWYIYSLWQNHIFDSITLWEKSPSHSGPICPISLIKRCTGVKRRNRDGSTDCFFIEIKNKVHLSWIFFSEKKPPCQTSHSNTCNMRAIKKRNK